MKAAAAARLGAILCAAGIAGLILTRVMLGGYGPAPGLGPRAGFRPPAGFAPRGGLGPMRRAPAPSASSSAAGTPAAFVSAPEGPA